MRNYIESDIAIIGISCRYPGASNYREFWKNLKEGKESITQFSDTDLVNEGIPSDLLGHKNYVKSVGYIPDLDEFDAPFFSYSPTEARLLDPQQRIFLEQAWSSLEDAGYDPGSCLMRIGVFAGGKLSTYFLHNIFRTDLFEKTTDFFQAYIANEKDFLAARTAYKVNLKGPSITVQTACSTSLVAVHLASQAILNGECDMALAGGISLMFPQKTGYLYQEGMIFSPDGHCRALDKDAQGTVPSNGVGIVVLKGLQEAIADGDNIHAIIRGSAVNNDGADKIGFSAPSIEGQFNVISEALAVAGVRPAELSFIETHGTATPLGDAIEISALKKVFNGEYHSEGCALGSVKSNIGHADNAAGIAGLIKAVLALKEKALPPSLHFSGFNKNIDCRDTGFYVNTTLKKLPEENKPVLAGVSSFGMGGTNSHVVLEEYVSFETKGVETEPHIIVWSAKTSTSLEGCRKATMDFLTKANVEQLRDIAYTLQLGRKAFEFREAMVINGDSTFVLTPDTTILGGKKNEPSILFVFTGRGIGLLPLVRNLLKRNEYFRNTFYACVNMFEGSLTPDFLERVVAAGEFTCINQLDLGNDQTKAFSMMDFVVEYTLADHLLHLGLRPQAILGIGAGELVALCIGRLISCSEVADILLGKPTANIPRVSNGEPMPIYSSLLERRVGIEDIETFYVRSNDANPDRPFSQVHYQCASLYSDYIQIGSSERVSGFFSQLMGQHQRYSMLFAPDQLACGMQKQLMMVVATCWVRGCEIDWRNLGNNKNTKRVSLPTYCFDRHAYWLAPEYKISTGKTLAGNTVDPRQGNDTFVDWLYLPRWKQISNFSGSRDVKNQSVIIVLATRSNFCRQVIEYLNACREVVIVYQHDEFKHNGSEFYIREDNIDDYVQLLQGSIKKEFRSIEIIHLWQTDALQEPISDFSRCEEVALNAFMPLVNLACALGRQPSNITFYVRVITTQVFDAIGYERMVPARSAILGVCKVMSTEYSNVLCRHIDVENHDDIHESDNMLQTILSPDIFLGHAKESLAYRGRYLWKCTYERAADLTTNSVIILKPKGIYVVTGGVSGIGLTLAEYLAVQYQAKLVLITRRHMPPREQWQMVAQTDGSESVGGIIKAILSMEQMGAEVSIITCDVADHSRMKEVFGEIKNRYGHITGVIHAAGVPSSGVIERIDRDSVKRTFAAKIKGTMILKQLLSDTNCGFLLLCSSLTSVLGGFAQADYCGANIFQDNFARLHDDASMRCIAVNWDAWLKVGMSARAKRNLLRYRPRVKVNHPLIQYVDPESLTYYSDFALHKDWVLNEHKIGEYGLLVGTTYIEIVVSAFKHFTHSKSVEIDEIFFLAPCLLKSNEACMLRTRFSPTKTGYTFDIVNTREIDGSTVTVENARGSIRTLAVVEKRQVHIQEIQERLSASTFLNPEQGTIALNNKRVRSDSYDFDFLLANELVSFGPRWKCLRNLSVSGDEATADIHLPEKYRDEAHHYMIHPALLDVATGHYPMLLEARAAPENRRNHVPFSYKRLKIYAPLPPNIFSNAKLSENSGGDNYYVQLVDSSGHLLAEIGEYCRKMLEPHVTSFSPELILTSLKKSLLQSGLNNSQVNIDVGDVADAGISAHEGTLIFERAVNYRESQLLISTTDLDTRLERDDLVPGLIKATDIPNAVVSASPSPYLLSTTEIESVIQQIWREQLGVKEVGSEDDYFDLGGDSLLATKVISRIREALGTDVPIGILFDQPTPRQLAAFIKSYSLSNDSPSMALEGRQLEEGEL